VQVYANDLNPRSHHWLAVNIKLNKARRLAIPWPLEAHAAVPEGPGLLLLRRRCLT
jgi:tRNA G37 N-methylase Trm5